MNIVGLKQSDMIDVSVYDIVPGDVMCGMVPGGGCGFVIGVVITRGCTRDFHTFTLYTQRGITTVTLNSQYEVYLALRAQ